MTNLKSQDATEDTEHMKHNKRAAAKVLTSLVALLDTPIFNPEDITSYKILRKKEVTIDG